MFKLVSPSLPLFPLISLSAPSLSSSISLSSHPPLSLSLSYPDDVVHAVDVRVSHVDAYGAEREAVSLARALDGDW